MRGARVLVAEDDAILALDVIGALLRAGAHVIGPAFSLERALELAEMEALTCGVLDVRLRDGLVFPAARVLKQKSAGIVFHTGQSDRERIKCGWPDAQVLIKPAPQKLLMQAIIAACLSYDRSSCETPLKARPYSCA